MFLVIAFHHSLLVRLAIRCVLEFSNWVLHVPTRFHLVLLLSRSNVIHLVPCFSHPKGYNWDFTIKQAASLSRHSGKDSNTGISRGTSLQPGDFKSTYARERRIDIPGLFLQVQNPVLIIWVALGSLLHFGRYRVADPVHQIWSSRRWTLRSRYALPYCYLRCNRLLLHSLGVSSER